MWWRNLLRYLKKTTQNVAKIKAQNPGGIHCNESDFDKLPKRCERKFENTMYMIEWVFSTILSLLEFGKFTSIAEKYNLLKRVFNFRGKRDASPHW